jgi:hypothetical protein
MKDRIHNREILEIPKIGFLFCSRGWRGSRLKIILWT